LQTWLYYSPLDPEDRNGRRSPKRSKRTNKFKQLLQQSSLTQSSLSQAKTAPRKHGGFYFAVREARLPQDQREDIILVINRAVAKGRFPGLIRAAETGYTNTGATTVLLDKCALGSYPTIKTYWSLQLDKQTQQ